ncbi:MAG TPA: arginine--tRNA ligase [Gaiellaceae bacterium]|nr:arginine--tRNA ligase [Gaiellaceae bacterium]
MPGSHAVRRLEAELSELAGAPVALERPSKAEHGDYATNVALQSAPAARRPRELAEELAGKATGVQAVARAEVAGPGFLNLWLEPAWFGDALAEILEAGAGYGAGSAENRQRIQVELVSANPTGPLTVGHGRNGAYGDSVARLLGFAGHDVEREHYFNDVGRQIELFRESVDARRRGEEPPDGSYAADYVDAIAAQSGDPVDRMKDAIRAELEAFRVPVDTWAHQAAVEQEIPAALERIDTYEAEGTRWARTTAHGDDKDRPLVRSADGSYLYFAADVAYVLDKLSRGFDRAIYVLGADHHGYVRRLQAAAGLLGFDPERVEVLIYQLVSVVEHGEAKRMSKRRGDVVFLSELVEKIGVDAARWYLVSRGHDQPIEIDVDLAAEQTQKNPVYYVQYAHARIAGIMRNAGDAAISAEVPPELADEERDLVKRLTEFPGIVAEATERRAAHALPTYAIRVADDFHRFYHHHRVLEAGEAQAFRLGLCKATQAVIARALDLVGVEAPERM